MVSLRQGFVSSLPVCLLAALLIVPSVVGVNLVVGVSGASAEAQRINDNGSQVTYSAGWTGTAKSGYYSSDAHYTATTGATATVSFTGFAVAWIGGKAPDHGKADVKVCDGAGNNCGPTTTVDTFAASASPQQALYSAAGLSNGSHTLIITVRADSSGTGHYTDTDAFDITSSGLSGTYYVSSDAGCSNAGAGTSTGSPWCDFSNLNGQTLAAGTQILLKRGDTFNSSLGRLYGVGTSTQPIILGAYGSGPRPKIIGPATASSRAVWIEDASFWEVRSLEIGNFGAGLVFWYNINGNQSLVIDDVYTHDVRGVFAGSPAQSDLPGMYHSSGILITGNVPVTASAIAIKDITISNVEGYNNNDDLDISGFNANSGGQQGFLSTALGDHSVANVNVFNGYFHNSQSGLNFDNLNNLRIAGMRLVDTGSGANGVGTTALFFWNVTNVTVSNSILAGEKSTNSPDQSEVDLEAYDDSVRFRGNYFGYPAGPAIEVLQINGDPNNYQSNHEVRGNLFESIGTYPLWQVTAQTPTNFSGTAVDNLYAPTSTTFASGGAFPNWTFTNNRGGAVASTYNAGRDFSSIQGTARWENQYFTTAAGWSDIYPYDNANERWGTDGYVSRFFLKPDTCATCAVARAWIAPTTGLVDIRSQVHLVENGGDGVKARITKNGVQVWPAGATKQTIAANDVSGVSANLQVAVNAGDAIRFEVDNSGSGDVTSDATAWAPSLMYSNGTLRINDTDGSISYSSGWTATPKSGYFSSDAKYTATTGAAATVAFNGTGITWIGGKAPDHGKANLQICDSAGTNCGTATVVDTYSATATSQESLFNATGLSAGSHTLKITVRSDSSGLGHYTDVDAFDIVD